MCFCVLFYLGCSVITAWLHLFDMSTNKLLFVFVFSPLSLFPRLQVRKYPMFTLGAVADLSLKQRTLDWALKSGEVKTQDTFYPIGSVASNAVGAEMTWKYFQEVRTHHQMYS